MLLLCHGFAVGLGRPLGVGWVVALLVHGRVVTQPCLYWQLCPHCAPAVAAVALAVVAWRLLRLAVAQAAAWVPGWWCRMRVAMAMGVCALCASHGRQCGSRCSSAALPVGTGGSVARPCLFLPSLADAQAAPAATAARLGCSRVHCLACFLSVQQLVLITREGGVLPGLVL